MNFIVQPSSGVALELFESNRTNVVARVVFTAAVHFAIALSEAEAADGRLTITALDEETRQPMAVRMELRDARGRPVRVRPDNAVVLEDGVYFEGSVLLDLRRGQYTFLIEAGPEFRTRPGRFQIDRNSEGTQEVTLLRRVDLRREGWYAGDLDVQLPPGKLELPLKARAVDVAPLSTAVNTCGKCSTIRLPANWSRSELLRPAFGPWASLDLRSGSGMLLINADGPPDVCRWQEGEPSLSDVRTGREEGAVAVALSPFVWDLPIWLAGDQVDAIQLIHRHALRDGVVDNESWGRPRDRSFFSGATGNARYSEQIYYHVLNCGLRIAPAAGSGAGSNSNPVGENRVYVHCGDVCTRQDWLDGLVAGRVSVSNGPLLRTMVEGEPPGQVFYLDDGESREFQIGLNLAFYDEHQVEYLEIVKNGEVVHEVRLDELAKQSGRLPPVAFDDSGWFLVRAVTDKPNVHQYATTGPYYVEAEYRRRVSRNSVEYFLRWLDDAAAQFAENGDRLAAMETARQFWLNLREQANAE